MILKLLRDTFTDKSTSGTLSIDGRYECVTLEDADRKLEEAGEKIYGQTAIPRGKYSVVLDFSNRFQSVMPRLVNVPDFSGVRIHTGNKNEDTDGCILVGRGRSEDWITESHFAYEALMKKLNEADERGEPISIEVA